MAWTSPMTYTSGDALTASQLNTHLRDNLNETEVAKATIPGAWLMSTSSTSITPRLHKSGYRQAYGGTTSTSYTTTLSNNQSGPSVTLSTGSEVIVMISSLVNNQAIETSSSMSYSVSGATSVSASDNWCISSDRSTAGSETLMRMHYHTGLNSGTNTFTCVYKSGSGGDAQFQCRRIQIIPL